MSFGTAFILIIISFISVFIGTILTRIEDKINNGIPRKYFPENNNNKNGRFELKCKLIISSILEYLDLKRFDEKSELGIVAGEANYSAYKTLKPYFEKALDSGANMSVVFGPRMDIPLKQFQKYCNVLDSSTIKKELFIHPLIELLNIYPNNIKLYQNTNGNYKHFVYLKTKTKNRLIDEDHHEPLEEAPITVYPLISDKYLAPEKKKLDDLISANKEITLKKINKYFELNETDKLFYDYESGSDLKPNRA